MRFDNEAELERILLSYQKESGKCFVTGSYVDFLYQQLGIGQYGIIDLLGVRVLADPAAIFININIYELKINNIKLKDVAQISRYYQGIIEYLENAYSVPEVCVNNDLCVRRHNKLQGKRCRIEVDVRGILIGRAYDLPGYVCFLVDSIPWLDCYHYSIDRDGVKFELS